MNISYSGIYKLCNYETAFFKGMNYYNNGQVKKVTKTRINSFEEYIEARVKGSHMYNVSIWCENDTPVRSLCDCPAFEKHEGICKHIAAVLFSCITKREEKVSLFAQNNESSPVLSVIINNYKNSDAKLSGAFSAKKAELYPVLHIKPRGRCSVEFKIGLSRDYIIKDLCEFAENVKCSKEGTYGKNVTFMHNKNMFSKKANKYIEVISEAVEENRIFNTVFNKYSYLAKFSAREIELTPHLLDKFMEIADGGEIEAIADKKEYKFSVVRKNPRFSFSFSQNESGSVSVKTDRYMYLSGSERLYIITDDEILMTDEDYKDKMGGIIETGTEVIASDGFTISDADMIFFYNNIIPKISVYSNIFADNIDLSKYEMPTPEVSFYIDSDSTGKIQGKCEILYGDKMVNPFNLEDIQSYRDTVLEYKIKSIMEKYFESSFEGVFETEDEDAVFLLLRDGLDELKNLGTVYVTDGFKKLSIQDAPKISVGLSLKSELLELNFYSEEFDLKELKNLLKSYHAKKKYHRLKDGTYLTLEEDTELLKLAEAADSLNLFENARGDDAGRFELPKYRALYLDRLFSGSGEVVRDYEFRSLIRNIKTAQDSEFEVPESLKKVLRPYQRHGFRWLKTMDMYGFGGILADDMGLGKTLQIISLLLSEKEEKNEGTSLIVCPASLIYNWESEIKKFAPILSTLTVTGDIEERQKRIDDFSKFDVLVTSYDLLKRDEEFYKDKTFRFLIIDEAQYIKNYSTQSAKAVKTIRAKGRFALTGTPIENRLSELWSIFDFLMPGFLFSYTKFRKELEAPAIRDGEKAAYDRIKNMVSPFILRRLKTDVLKELPEKSEHIFVSQMGDEQRKIYMANVKALKDTIENNTRSSLREDTIRILAMLTRLRQLCCDPSLCYEDYKGGSAKLESAVSLIKKATESGHKVLLFSQFTSMLEIIERRLEEDGIKFYTLVGATPKEQRLSLVNSFQTNDVPVFLISLKSGGTGLNLTSADVVIHFDPWWNLAAQNQATDRTHRIGQKNAVTVYKLIAKDTIEEKILNLQKSKKNLADSIISENGINISDMSKEELIALLEMNE